jgi:CheY-like chemotaxis protein
LGRVSVLLADDHGDFLAAVVRHLEPHFEVVKAVGNGQALLDEAARLEPGVIGLDISMPVLNGIEAARGAADCVRLRRWSGIHLCSRSR